MDMLESVGNVYTWAAVVAAFAIGYLVYSKFSSPDDYSHKRTDQQEPKESAMASVTPPRKGDYTPQQLLEHDGRDPSKAILLSLFSERRPPVIPPPIASPPRRGRVRCHCRRQFLRATQRSIFDICRS